MSRMRGKAVTDVTNVKCDVQTEEQQQMQLSEIAAQHSSEQPVIRSGAGRTESVCEAVSRKLYCSHKLCE